MADISYHYEDETVLVTGASSGIGREIALRFGDAGATVINADLRRDPKDVGEEVPTDKAISWGAGEGRYVETDISDPEQLEAAVAVGDEYDGIDVMVNNAGLFIKGGLFETTEEDFERIHSINAKGTFFGCQAAAADMVDRGTAGTIVNVASISSTHAQKRQIPYDSTKGAIRMITRGAALELSDYDIRVNAVAPGHVATEFGSGAEKKVEAVANDEVSKTVPLGRAGFPEDIAGSVLFLASEDAGYLTGEMVYVDGGWQTY
ncbi:SDR family NAD(P)-dependent oxidoreductase [Halomarina halobia]|uniref:SDR family NAD(P)-dependent oxidoreductase n=1 Tax=Halomarina halobia TaxID=3033386 RepID=A0ABD6ADG9_9EURY|nr:SDR family oxidoreductase [Halomarina sp. PSR21]